MSTSDKEARSSDVQDWLAGILPDGSTSVPCVLRGSFAARAKGCGSPGMYLVASGRIWFAWDGGTDGHRPCRMELGEGDLVLMPSCVEHDLAERPGLSSRPVEEVFEEEVGPDGWYRLGRGPERARLHTFVVGTSPLPRVAGFEAPIPQRRAEQTAVVRHLVRALTLELEGEGRDRSGAQVRRPAVDAIVKALWIKVLSERLNRNELDLVIMNATLAALEQIESIGTVEQLARLANLSRSRFHERFAAFVGQAPTSWLRRERMRRARRLLQGGTSSVAEIAERMGYASESAFRKAFKRELGESARVRR